jgi:hypothetical protein
MKKFIILAVLMACTYLHGEAMYRKGVEDVEWDRASADIKLQNCNEVITKFPLEH